MSHDYVSDAETEQNKPDNDVHERKNPRHVGVLA